MAQDYRAVWDVDPGIMKVHQQLQELGPDDTETRLALQRDINTELALQTGYARSIKDNVSPARYDRLRGELAVTLKALGSDVPISENVAQSVMALDDDGLMSEVLQTDVAEAYNETNRLEPPVNQPEDTPKTMDDLMNDREQYEGSVFAVPEDDFDVDQILGLEDGYDESVLVADVDPQNPFLNADGSIDEAAFDDGLPVDDAELSQVAVTQGDILALHRTLDMYPRGSEHGAKRDELTTDMVYQLEQMGEQIIQERDAMEAEGHPEAAREDRLNRHRFGETLNVISNDVELSSVVASYAVEFNHDGAMAEVLDAQQIKALETQHLASSPLSHPETGAVHQASLGAEEKHGVTQMGAEVRAAHRLLQRAGRSTPMSLRREMFDQINSGLTIMGETIDANYVNDQLNPETTQDFDEAMYLTDREYFGHTVEQVRRDVPLTDDVTNYVVKYNDDDAMNRILGVDVNEMFAPNPRYEAAAESAPVEQAETAVPQRPEPLMSSQRGRSSDQYGSPEL